MSLAPSPEDLGPDPGPAVETRPGDPIPVARRGAPSSLSFAQQRLESLYRSEPGSPARATSSTLRLRGPLS
nr:hypothetical protein [Acidobacteriota bacterium]